MKINLKAFFIILIIFTYSEKILIAQNSEENNKLQFGITLESPPLYIYKSKLDGAKYYSFQLGIEANWHSKKHLNRRYSYNIKYAKLVDNYNETLIAMDFSMLLGNKNHFLELGVGMDSQVLLNGIIGYRLYIKNNFLLKLQLLPSSYVPIDFLNDEIHNYLHINAGIGYQFNQKDSKTISNFFDSTWNRLSLQSSVYPFSYEEMGLISPSLVFDLNISLFTHGNSGFGVYGGFGINTEDILFQTGISYLYGKGNHFVEANFNLIFIEITEFNDEYSWHDDYRLLQPQLGYRYQCQKLPMFARIAYAPYIRTLDWKREGGLHHNMVLGLGYRFGK